MPATDRLTISTVTYGPFVEYIPQIGQVEADTIKGHSNVLVEIDQWYIMRISVGLIATTEINNKYFELEIEEVLPAVVDGRFRVRLCFNNEIPVGLREPKAGRLRIQLGKTTNQILLPVDNFYRDTGGSWVFVMASDHRAVRRNIVLGRKMGSEYFEVVDGLMPGDRVITSSYENFIDGDSLDTSDLNAF